MESKTFQNKIKSISHKWRTDYVRKTVISSLFSLSITVLFALYNGFLGIHLLSIWHGSICVFYLLIVLIRGIILSAVRRSNDKPDSKKTQIRYKAFIISTIILLLLNLALICPIVLMVKFEKPVNIGLIPSIAMATYTTFKITMAFIHIHRQAKRKEHNNVLITELRTINLIDALISILTLQNTLIMVNSTKSDIGNMLTLSAVSSGVIYMVIVFITILLMTAGIKQQKK